MLNMYIPNNLKNALGKEYITKDLKIYLTRYLENKLFAERDLSSEQKIILQNDVINKSLQIQSKPIYVLQTDEEYYMSPEYAWHNAEFHLIFRRLDTLQTIEYLGDLISSRYFNLEEINQILSNNSLTFRFAQSTNEIPNLSVQSISKKEIENLIKAIDSEDNNVHKNIMILFDRLTKAHADKDYTLVVHTSASIFETLAKDIVSDPLIVDKSLGQFFDSRYRSSSNLPKSILDYMKGIFSARNKTPTAGHGSTADTPAITEQESLLLVELTKAFVRSEYKMLAAETTHT